MRSTTIVVFAVLASLLVVGAQPAGAASTKTVVGSAHTNATDFNNANVLDNVSIQGSGDNAFVRVAQSAQVDDAESGNTDDWTVDGQAGDSITTTTSNVYQGTYTYEYSGSGDYYGAATRTTISGSGNVSTSVFVRDSSTDNDDAAFLAYRDTANNQQYMAVFQPAIDQIQLRKSDGGAASHTGIASQAVTISEDTYYEIEFEYDQDTGAMTMWLFDTSGTELAQVSGSDSSYSPTHAGIGAYGNDPEFDNYELPGGVSSLYPATYVSSNHSVTNATRAWANLTLTNVSATVTVQEWTGSAWSDVNMTTVSTTANHTIDVSSASHETLRTNVTFTKTGTNPTAELHDEGVLFVDHAPTVDNSTATPSGGSVIGSQSATLEINASDQEFGTAQGESLNATAYDAADDSMIASTTLGSNGTASVSWSSLDAGTNEYYWRVNDSYELGTVSETFDFQVPGNVSVYNESAPTQLVNDSVTLRLRFFVQDEPQVIEREVTDGTANLGGVPADKRIVITVDANTSAYYYRRVVIESIVEQQEIYLLPTSADAADVEFRLQDYTGGQFAPAETRLYIEAPITKDFDGDGTNETEYKTIFGDTFGSAGEFPATLRQDERYRLRLVNEDGDERVLGSYTATRDEVETITVKGLTFDPPEGQGWTTNLTATRDPRELTWKYMDPTGETTSLEVQVTNETGAVIYSDTKSGTFENYSVYGIPLDNDTQYTLEWNATRNGETNGEVRPVGGGSIGITIPFDADWLGTLGMVTVVFTLSLAGVRKTTYVAMSAVAIAGVLMALQAVTILVPLWWLAAFIAAGAHLKTMQQPEP